MKGYPTWLTKNVVHLLISALLISGLLLLPTTLFSQLEWEGIWRLQSDHRIWVTALHVLSSFLTLILLGALWSIHMRYWWRKGLARWSGSVLVALFVFLGLSGLGALYFGQEDLLKFARLSHAFVGVLLVAPYLWHQWQSAERIRRNS